MTSKNSEQVESNPMTEEKINRLSKVIRHQTPLDPDDVHELCELAKTTLKRRIVEAERMRKWRGRKGKV